MTTDARCVSPVARKCTRDPCAIGKALGLTTAFGMLVGVTAALALTLSTTHLPAAHRQLQQDLDVVVREAFAATHNGYSSDEVLLSDSLQDSFLAHCRQSLPDVPAETFNWALLNLRKTGKLRDIPTTRFVQRHDVDWRTVAEIAARCVQDRHDLTIDRILASPSMRSEFDEAARQLAPEADPYWVRKAALQLRKTRRLQPELVTRIANWEREVTVFPLADLAENPARIPTRPGVYIFRDATGFLYVGEAVNLRNRLIDHLQGSDSPSLASYLQQSTSTPISVEFHTFADGAPIERLSVRRAYESELIRSRNPRFNIRP